ncbi:uncharacterized protein LOC134531454 [Bacillus rossius redtenbacheri]|uniref:uncharacterized protein LOC134531454 n=1 Tax=Bacillus rossius redtenbacheri TaxID=93214 RepID=UPI002FDCBF88
MHPSAAEPPSQCPTHLSQLGGTPHLFAMFAARHRSPANDTAHLASAPFPHAASRATQLPSHPPDAGGGGLPHPFAVCPRSPASDAAHLASAPPPHDAAGSTQLPTHPHGAATVSPTRCGWGLAASPVRGLPQDAGERRRYLASAPPPQAAAGAIQLSPYPLGAGGRGTPHPFASCTRTPASDAAHITSTPTPQATAGAAQPSPHPLGAGGGGSPHPFAACPRSPSSDAAHLASPACDAIHLASAPPPHVAVGATQLTSHPLGAGRGSPPHMFAACSRSPVHLSFVDTVPEPACSPYSPRAVINHRRLFGYCLYTVSPSPSDVGSSMDMVNVDSLKLTSSGHQGSSTSSSTLFASPSSGCQTR